MLIHDTLPDSHRFAGLQATPIIPTAPQIWLLGTSRDSASLSAMLGTGFAFAQFINGDGGMEAMKVYQQEFNASPASQKPRSLVAVVAVCAETAEEADRQASSMDLSLVLLEKEIGRASCRERVF